MARRRKASAHPSHLLPDELWALVLSKCSWADAWQQVRTLLLWRPGAGEALTGSEDRLVELFLAQQQHSQSAPLVRAVRRGRTALVRRLLDSRAAGQEDEGAQPWYSRPDNGRVDCGKFSQLQRALPIAGRSNRPDMMAALLAKCTSPDAEAVIAGMVCAALQGHMEVLALVRPWVESAGHQFTVLLDNPLFTDAALLAAAVQQLGAHSCSLLLPLAVLMGREHVARAVLHGSPYAFVSVAAKPEALQMAAACREDVMVRLLLAHNGPQGIPAAVMEQLLAVPAIASNAEMVQLLVAHAAVRTRAALRHYDVLVEMGAQAGVTEETALASCMVWMRSLTG